MDRSPLLPAWARVADLLVLGLVVLGIVVAISGGFRVRFGTWRVALTSPVRLLLWAAVAEVARHVVVPRPPVYRDLPVRLRAAWTTPGVRAARSVFLGTRPAVLFVGYLAVFMFGYREGGAPFKMFDNEFGNLQVRWDTGWYLGIAIEGYQYDAGRPQDQQNIVFFPAFPLLVRGTARLLGGSSTAFVAAGTVVALAAFFGGLVYLFRLAREMLGSEEQARASAWLLATFPFALFYSAIYTESLFLLGAVAALFHFRRRELWRASGWGLLVGLTRPNGCFVSIPLALLAIAPLLPAWLRGGSSTDGETTESWRSRDRPLWPALLAAATPTVGVLVYSGFVWQLAGNPLAWAQGQMAWGRQYNGLGVLVSQRYEWLSQGGLYEYTANVPGDLLNALGALSVLAAAWPVARRLGAAYAVFVLVNMLPPLAAGGFLSAGRLGSTMFPSFIWLGSAVPSRHRPAWIATFMAIQAFNAALFYTWRPLY